MTAAESEYTPLTCVLPDCTADLHLNWTLSRPLYVGDRPASLPEPGDAYTSTWEVACEEGHVLLVPGHSLCPCGDDECAHTDFDGSDDLRTFRAHDLARLLKTLDMLAKHYDLRFEGEQ